VDLVIKISLIWLAVTVAVFASIIDYQSLLDEHNHNLDYNDLSNFVSTPNYHL